MRRVLPAIVVALGLTALLTAQSTVTINRQISGGSGSVLGGAGGTVGTACGTLTTNTTQVATAANTTEIDGFNYSLPANTLTTNGQGVRVTASGTSAANANNKTVKLYFGATQVVGLSFTTSGAHWRVIGIVMRTAAATELASGELLVALGNNQTVVTTPAETLSGAVTIRATLQNGVATANDIVFRGAVVECL